MILGVPPNKRLKLAARANYGMISFFSAPQLKRDPLGGCKSMFYLLSQIDDGPLPHELLIHGTRYLVMRGGLLLEPPGPESDRFGEGEGHSTIKFFGRAGTNDEPRFLASSDESYRWKKPGQLDISRLDSDRGARFTGLVDGDAVQLVAEDGARFLVPGARLGFVAAPNEPITSDWSQTFDFGPPHVTPVDPSAKDSPVVQDAIRQFVATKEPDRHRTVRARLENAWRAPV